MLARGLAAGSADQYQQQRYRWGVGAMQVLRVDNPLTTPGLTLGQRLTYAKTLAGWFDAWRTLLYLLLPPLVLLTGAMPGAGRRLDLRIVVCRDLPAATPVVAAAQPRPSPRNSRQPSSNWCA